MRFIWRVPFKVATHVCRLKPLDWRQLSVTPSVGEVFIVPLLVASDAVLRSTPGVLHYSVCLLVQYLFAQI